MLSANYAIRWFGDEAGPCKACTGKTGQGVLGTIELEDEIWPACDNCLMELAPDLAIVVVAVQALREIGEMAQSRVPAHTLAQFLTFATATNRACAWPLRIRFLSALAEVSIDDVLEEKEN